MQIAVYSKAIGRDIIRISMEYCQSWNCYPAIEHYFEKCELLNALKNQDIDIVLFEGNRKDGESIIKEVEELDIRVNLIWLSTEALFGKDYQEKTGERQPCHAMLTQKIEEGLSAYEVAPSKESLCRVHLRSEKETP